MTILTSSIDHQLDSIYMEWTEAFGIGPCGAYAAMRREDGWGDVAQCQAKAEGDETGFTHYVILQDGDIIDLANPLGEELVYTDVEVFNADEMPELVSVEHIQWLRERMA